MDRGCPGREVIRNLIRLLLGGAVLFTLACGPTITTSDEWIGQETVVPVGPGDFAPIAWISDRDVVVGVIGNDGLGEPNRLSLDVGRLEPLELAERPECGLHFWTAFARRSDSFSMTSVCSRRDAPELADVDITVVGGNNAAEPQDLATLSEVPDQFVWFPDGDSALYSTGSLICETLRRLEAGRDRPLGWIVPGVKAYALDDFDQATESDCTNTGRTDFPTISADGQRVAFFGSGAAIGLQGQARLDAPSSIYTRSGSDDPMPVFDGVSAPAGLRWVLGDKWLAFSGTVKGSAGTWLVASDGSGLQRVSGSRLDWFDASPNGESVAGIIFQGPEDAPASVIVVIELPM